MTEREDLILDLLAIGSWTDLQDYGLCEELEEYYMEEIQGVPGG